MLIIRQISVLQQWILFHKKRSRSIGFVPTMGALHAGHISLIDFSKQDNDFTICSIFVNPTQFNDPKDLEKYPRTLESDSTLLASAQCDVLFYPSVSEIYPPDLTEIIVDLEGLDLVMEGEHRPGHFKGVVQVVHRLLDIVTPDRLYMGQKDFQQFTIIRHMIKKFNMSIQLVVCPICREPNGLAMSSRNSRLSVKGREHAGVIYATLFSALQHKESKTPLELCGESFDTLNQDPFKAEYVQIVVTHNLKPVIQWTEPGEKVICVAVWLEGVRLIDNILIDSNSTL